MKKPIKLYWSQSKPNFGDCLSPMIVEAIAGRAVEYASAKRCELIALGSLLHRLEEKFWTKRIHIWGTGFIEDKSVRNSRHFVHASRGVFSRNILNAGDVPVGDPGLLVDRVFGDKLPREKKYPVAIIPHYKDKGDIKIKTILERIPSAIEIDVFASPEDVLEKISASEIVLSSAMHGLIAADSLGVPNAWVQLSKGVRGNGFKFSDYYSVFQIDASPFPVDQDNLYRRIEDMAACWERPGIEQIKDDLVKSFPEI